MTEKQIKQTFTKVVQDNELMKPIGASKDQLYNWRNPERKNTSIAAMLEVLWKLGMLEFKNKIKFEFANGSVIQGIELDDESARGNSSIPDQTSFTHEFNLGISHGNSENGWFTEDGSPIENKK